MALDDNAWIEDRIKRIRQLNGVGKGQGQQLHSFFEAASLARTVLYDTVGGSHPLMVDLDDALRSSSWPRAGAASRAVVTLYEQGGLTSPRLTIAHEIEADILDIAQTQTEASEKSTNTTHKQLQLAIAAFLAGASLEDALRRLCEAQGITYDPQRATISKLQAALFQPSKQIEIISTSENKQITAWGDTRNKADHAKFGDITHTEVVTMVMGVRAFIGKHIS